MKRKFNNSEPLHNQLKKLIVSDIEAGKYRIGERIPSSADLRQHYDLSLITVRRAVVDLIREGYLKGIQGKGTYVVRKHAMPQVPSTSLVAFVHAYELSNPFFSNIFHYAEEVLRQAGYTLIFASSSEDAAEEARLLLGLRDRQIKGALLIPYHKGRTKDDDSVLSSLDQGGFPLVMVDHKAAGLPFDYAGSDNFQMAYDAVNYLLELGHKHIGVIYGAEMSSARERMQGYKSALKEARIKYNPKLVVKGSHGLPSVAVGEVGAEKLLQERQRPTAILCINDEISHGACRYCNDNNIAVPSELSILGFDDLPLCSFSSPELSTIAQNTAQIGRQAATILLNKIKFNSAPPVEYKIPGKLKIRQSTGKPCSHKVKCSP